MDTRSSIPVRVATLTQDHGCDPQMGRAFAGGPRRERGFRFYLPEEHNVKKLWIPALLALALAALVVPAQAGAVTFPDGVASGDVTSTRAVLWTRVDTATNIKVEGWTNAALSGPKAFQGKFKTSAARDYTVKIDQGGLTPNTTYWYRFK